LPTSAATMHVCGPKNALILANELKEGRTNHAQTKAREAVSIISAPKLGVSLAMLAATTNTIAQLVSFYAGMDEAQPLRESSRPILFNSHSPLRCMRKSTPLSDTTS